ncbi:hypothetical protein CEXT_371021 [Caerostris extrusa]|uniref:Uncharacterized protein n=1 Tax=Caerostris extrusa TaxID=172846 RepID=A0AAV4RKE1_CAEEX|nr:hypothetical protein CEXT_371021 [Caerostris extrusa]
MKGHESLNEPTRAARFRIFPPPASHFCTQILNTLPARSQRWLTLVTSEYNAYVSQHKPVVFISKFVAILIFDLSQLGFKIGSCFKFELISSNCE